MPCVHLRKLYQLCHQEGLRIGGTDLIRIVCQQCGIQDECPSMLVEEYEARTEAEGEEAPPAVPQPPAQEGSRQDR